MTTRTDPMTDPTDLLSDLLGRSAAPVGATVAQCRAWDNRRARAIVAQVEPLIAAELLARAGSTQSVAHAPPGLPGMEMLRWHAARGMAQPPTDVRGVPR
jgi:hypothetical protein